MPRSPVHLALGCDDILYEVFRHIRTLPTYSKPRQSLYACARACHVFCEPALDALWMELDSLQPLLELFEGCHVGCNGYYYCLNVVGLPENLERFRRYARRVRVLTVPREMKFKSAKRFAFLTQLATVLSLTSHTPLFPTLTSLTWGTIGKHDPSLPLLLSPRLRSLHVHYVSRCSGADRVVADADGGPSLSAQLAHFLVRAPALRVLRLTGLHDCPASVADLEAHAGTARMLAGIRRLEEVEIHMESTVRFDECACARGAAAKMGLGVEWPVLRRLTLAGPSAALTAAVPIFAHAPQLSELCLSSTSASTADDALLMGALPTLRHLRTLRLEFTGRHPIDEGLSRLASAWPPEQLLELEIRWRALRNTVWTSAAILQDFAEHCRALRRLVLPPLDFQPVLSLSRASSPGNAASGVVEQKQESSLRELRLQSILLAGCDVSAAATYVERLFPTLELCEGAAPCEPVSNAWSKVEEVLKERLRIRAACTQMTSLCLRP